MENEGLILPDQKDYEYALNLAYEIACKKIADIDDIEQQCLRSDAQYQVINSQKEITLHYLNRRYRITFPGVEISQVDATGEVPLREKVLILHYFISAKGTPASKKIITFRELPAGTVYSPTFNKRTTIPLITYFSKDPRLLVEISKRLGGHKAEYGDAAVTINAFSRVPITIVLWQGDDELSAQGNILFDANITDYLSTEDVTVLCEIITWRLIRQLRES